MPARDYGVELRSSNNRQAAALGAETAQNWDPELWRGPRILVPIAVEALVVEEGAAPTVWAHVRIDPKAANPAQREPQPFQNRAAREPGVHLHWALPDGLTRGVVPPDDPADPDATIDPVFPLVPDRWVVIRTHPGRSPEARRIVTAWVIESETRKTSNLQGWTEDRANAQPRWLTALGEGDPAYAAYFDNVEDMLAFHDPLDGVPAGPLTYVVVGWYSSETDDPLFAAETVEQWFGALDALGWALDSKELGRIRAAAREAAARQESAGAQPKHDKRVQKHHAFIAKSSPQSKTANKKLQELNVEIPAGFYELAAQSKATWLSDALLFEKYWARQMLCHGMVYDVRWKKGGGDHDVEPAGIPAANTVGMAMGNTTAEAIAASIAASTQRSGLERVVTGFGYGTLPELADPDGVAAFESRLHFEQFAPRAAGYTTDTIEEGDIAPPEASPRLREASARTTGFQAYEGVGRYSTPTPKLQFGNTRGSLAELMVKVAEARSDSVGSRPRTTREVRRALPRYWEPREPVILFTAAHRSYKHGEDGRLSPDGKLVCRITGETIRSLSPIIGAMKETGRFVRTTVRGENLTTEDLTSGQIPPEVGAIFVEALLLDETTAEVAAAAIVANPQLLANALEIADVRHDVSKESLRQKIAVEQTLLWNATRLPTIDIQALTAVSGLEGRLPSKIAVQPWVRPWTPLHVDWEVEWFQSPGNERKWLLDEHDAEWPDLEDFQAGGVSEKYTGRSLLTAAVVASFAGAVRKYLEDEAAGMSDSATEAQEAGLQDAVDALANLDTLAASLGTLHAQMLGRVEKMNVTAPGGTVPTLDETFAHTDKKRFPVRAGHLRFSRIRIIDCFGQFYEMSDQARNAITRSEDLKVDAAPGFVRLRPRLIPPTRLSFRMLTAARDDVEATKRETPVCGWLLPDHLDESLEVYDADGENVGQVQTRPESVVADPEAIDATNIVIEWQNVPGRPGPLGGRPQLANRHLQGFINGILARGVEDSQQGIATDDRSESVLSALLRMIDATLWTVDPLGREGDEHLSVLVGRPLAVVRAELRLDTLWETIEEEADVEAEMRRAEFEVRLGVLTDLHDGLIGYFVNDDYSHFYPVHEAIADNTRLSRPRGGFLGSVHDSPLYYQQFDERPVNHPYIDRKSTIGIRPRQKVLLTLLVDPRGAVHATSGILPRKRIELMREHVAAALARWSITFRVGPVLSDPEVVRMPLPAEIKNGAWSWIGMKAPGSWREDPVVASSRNTGLSETPITIHEGWLKLSPRSNAEGT